ncbi:MAG: hypothetical protein ACK5C5_03465 [Bacteroidota bacterium]
MSKVLRIIKSYFLQFLLGALALISYIQVEQLGRMQFSDNGEYFKTIDFNHTGETVGTSVAVSTGYNGGAIAMGLICSVCIVMIVWIEIRKTSN